VVIEARRIEAGNSSIDMVQVATTCALLPVLALKDAVLDTLGFNGKTTCSMES
jgi:hypothetical protein